MGFQVCAGLLSCRFCSLTLDGRGCECVCQGILGKTEACDLQIHYCNCASKQTPNMSGDSKDAPSWVCGAELSWFGRARLGLVNEVSSTGLSIQGPGTTGLVLHLSTLFSLPLHRIIVPTSPYPDPPLPLTSRTLILRLLRPLVAAALHCRPCAWEPFCPPSAAGVGGGGRFPRLSLI